MSDQNQSGFEPGASAPTAPAATSSAPAAATSGVPATFGTGRGTGLARGRRKPAPAAPAAARTDSPSGDYQPTAVQLVTVESEYKNPFAPAVEEAPAAHIITAATPAP